MLVVFMLEVLTKVEVVVEVLEALVELRFLLPQVLVE